MNNQWLSDMLALMCRIPNMLSVYLQTVLTNTWWCLYSMVNIQDIFSLGLTLLTFTYTSALLWTEWGLWAARRVEIIKHIGTLVQNHAAML